MRREHFPKIKSLVQLYELLPEEERIITDVLRQIITENLPANCKEKISYNVPFFYGNRSICLVWPSTVPWGGIKKGVMLAFWYGNRLADTNQYLTHGTNKQVYYKIFLHAGEIEEAPLVAILKEAAALDLQHTSKNKPRSKKK